MHIVEELLVDSKDIHNVVLVAHNNYDDVGIDKHILKNKLDIAHNLLHNMDNHSKYI